MALTFQKASKAKGKLRLAIVGVAGGGKTWTGLTVACRLAEAEGGRAAVIDSERGSASLYADLFDFDVLELDTFAPDQYVEAIKAAERAGYRAILIDSLSHAWAGKGGALQLVDEERIRSKSGNSFNAWREVTPMHDRLVDAMLQSPAHVVATMRSKMEYVQEKDPSTGKTSIRPVSLQPVQRDGLEFEFTLVADIDREQNFIVGKSRCRVLPPGTLIKKPTAEVADTLLAWLETGVDADPTPSPAPSPTASATSSSANGAARGAAVTRTSSAPQASAGDSPAWQDRPANEPQIKAIYAIARGAQAMDDGTLEQLCREKFGTVPAELTRRQAADLIDMLKLGGDALTMPSRQAAHTNGAARPKAQVSDLYDTSQDTRAMPEHRGIPPRTDAAKAVVKFWMAVMALGTDEPATGFTTSEGEIAKVAVHRALGLADDDGSLAAWVATGHSYPEALQALRLGIPVAVRAEPAADPQQPGLGLDAPAERPLSARGA